MASRSILNGIFSFSLLAAVLLISGCGTTQETSRQPNQPAPSPEDRSEENTTALSQQLIDQIDANRSSLDDVYATRDSEMPAFFRQQSTARDIGDPRQGYRVQILSTRNVNRADSIANDFRFWAEDEFDDYIPQAYVLFRQPYYKVHIGNFQFHDQAMKLNQYLKQRYPDAWVVHDEVEPNLVPPESMQYGNEK